MRRQEAAAVMTALPANPPERRRGLRERLLAEWIAGAEEEWRRRNGRAMTAAELERVLRSYPGDL